MPYSYGDPGSALRPGHPMWGRLFPNGLARDPGMELRPGQWPPGLAPVLPRGVPQRDYGDPGSELRPGHPMWDRLTGGLPPGVPQRPPQPSEPFALGLDALIARLRERAGTGADLAPPPDLSALWAATGLSGGGLGGLGGLIGGDLPGGGPPPGAGPGYSVGGDFTASPPGRDFRGYDTTPENLQTWQGLEAIAPAIRRVKIAERRFGVPNLAETAGGFRSGAEQAALWAKKQAGLISHAVAPPGQSYHEQGEAIDFSTDVLARNPDLVRWLKTHGFVWDVPGEPWHARFVGGGRPLRAPSRSSAPKPRRRSAPAPRTTRRRAPSTGGGGGGFRKL